MPLSKSPKSVLFAAHGRKWRPWALTRNQVVRFPNCIVLYTTKVEVGDPDQESGPIVVWIIAEIAAAADAIAEHLSKHKTATNGQHKAAAGTTNFQEQPKENETFNGGKSRRELFPTTRVFYKLGGKRTVLMICKFEYMDWQKKY